MQVAKCPLLCWLRQAFAYAALPTRQHRQEGMFALILSGRLKKNVHLHIKYTSRSPTDNTYHRPHIGHINKIMTAAAITNVRDSL